MHMKKESIIDTHRVFTEIIKLKFKNDYVSNIQRAKDETEILRK